MKMKILGKVKKASKRDSPFGAMIRKQRKANLKVSLATVENENPDYNYEHSIFKKNKKIIESSDKVWADEDGNPSLIPIVGQPSFKGSIDVAGGKGNLVSIQKEDERGNWDAQNFATIKNGYWVIHKGKYHAIYEVK
jgi:hypothetical protein